MVGFVRAQMALVIAVIHSNTLLLRESNGYSRVNTLVPHLSYIHVSTTILSL